MLFNRPWLIGSIYVQILIHGYTNLLLIGHITQINSLQLTLIWWKPRYHWNHFRRVHVVTKISNACNLQRSNIVRAHRCPRKNKVCHARCTNVFERRYSTLHLFIAWRRLLCTKLSTKAWCAGWLEFYQMTNECHISIRGSSRMIMSFNMIMPTASAWSRRRKNQIACVAVLPLKRLIPLADLIGLLGYSVPWRAAAAGADCLQGCDSPQAITATRKCTLAVAKISATPANLSWCDFFLSSGLTDWKHCTPDFLGLPKERTGYLKTL